VIDSATLGCGGEVFITKMPVIQIKDLAEVMIRELAPRYGHSPEDIRIEVIGTKPGEKMYEELMNVEETRRAWELDRYFVVLPAFTSPYHEVLYDYPGVLSRKVARAYNSNNEDVLSQDKLTSLLRGNGLLDEGRGELFQPAERYWPS
jgi:FlaA1/EpsC-like NDP-sugar epimerase